MVTKWPLWKGQHPQSEGTWTGSAGVGPAGTASRQGGDNPGSNPMVLAWWAVWGTRTWGQFPTALGVPRALASVSLLLLRVSSWQALW